MIVQAGGIEYIIYRAIFSKRGIDTVLLEKDGKLSCDLLALLHLNWHDSPVP